MVIVYTFTKEERRVIQAAYQRYQSVVQVIAELHELTGNLNVDPNIGFMKPDGEPAAAGAPHQEG